MDSGESYTAFAGANRIAHGDLRHVAQSVKSLVDARESRPILVFADRSGAQVDLDLRGSMDDVLARYVSPDPAPAVAPLARRGPGRPKLGVVGREITLLPRHWEWLNVQPGGASVALRKLVERARRDGRSQDRVREAREAAYRFMSAIAGNEAGFEEASRALFSGDHGAFAAHTQTWPDDVRRFVDTLATEAFDREDPSV